MNVLIAVGSKYGSTMQIGEVVRDVLVEHGFDATLSPVDSAPDIDAYDAAILGSAVYMGHWLKVAKDFATAHGVSLRARPVWLFSSGPVGDPPKPEADALDIGEIIDATSPRDHRLFSGRIDKARLGFRDRAIVAALKAPEGDFRDWDEIRRWASGIAESLHAHRAA